MSQKCFNHASMTSVTRMGMVFEDDASGAWNEMFVAPGTPRPIYERLLADLDAISRPGAASSFRAAVAHLLDRGVTFAHSGEERPFPLDLVPRILGALEWDRLARGIAQRVRALEAFLADVYGEGRIFDEGLIPRVGRHLESALLSRGLRRSTPPNGVRIAVAGHRPDSRRARRTSACSRTTCASPRG